MGLCCYRKLAKLVESDGFANINEAVGADA